MLRISSSTGNFWEDWTCPKMQSRSFRWVSTSWDLDMNPIDFSTYMLWYCAKFLLLSYRGILGRFLTIWSWVSSTLSKNFRNVKMYLSVVLTSTDRYVEEKCFPVGVPVILKPSGKISWDIRTF